jgi:predicted Abi (CAAX) family protease
MVFRRELSLPCDLLFGPPRDKRQSTTDYVVELINRLPQDEGLANSMEFQEGDKVWLYRLTQIRGKSPKLKPSWEGPYKMITWINVVVYRIQRHARVRNMVVHLDRLAPYLGATWDKQP